MWFASLCTVLIAFPYCSVVFFPSDLQPLALGSVIAFLIYYTLVGKLSEYLNPLLTPLIFVCLYFLILGIANSNIVQRSLGAYVSIAAFSTFAYIATRNRLISSKLFLVICGVWVGIGVLQSVIDPDIATFLLRSARTTPGRGVVSLAPEPSYFGIQCLFLWVCLDNLSMDKNIRRIAKLGLALAIVLLSKSMLALIFLVLIVTLNFITAYRAISLYLTGFVVASCALASSLGIMPEAVDAMVGILPEGRMQNLVSMAAQNPSSLFTLDASGNQRFTDIFLPLLSFWDSFPSAFGFPPDSWGDFVATNFSDFTFLWYPKTNSSHPMSAYGQAIFELGFVGLLIPAVAHTAFYRSTRMNSANNIFLLILMFMAISLAYPLFGFLVGQASAHAQSSRKGHVCG